MDRTDGGLPQGEAITGLRGASTIELSWQDRVYRIVCYVLSTIWVAFTMFPLFWLLTSTFKDPVDIMKMPPDLIPKVPEIYTIQLDYTGVPLPEELTFEQAVREDLAIATWRVQDWLPNIRYGAMRAEAYLDGIKVAETFLPKHQNDWFRGRIWASQRLSDSLVRKEVESALFAAKFEMDPEGLAPVANKGGVNEFTEDVADLFGEQLMTTGSLVGVYARPYWPALANNFISAWRAPSRLSPGMSFAGYLSNSLKITLSDILLQWLVSGMAAYALSRILTPRFSRIWTIFFLVTMMVPGVATLIPMYELVGKMGLHDKLLGVIIPAIPGAFTIYLFKGFFDALPGDIFDSARIDGASEFAIFFRLVLPMSKNVFTVIGLLTFFSSWNNFFWPYLVLRSPRVWTFTIAIYMAMGGSGAAGTQYGSAMASAVMAAIPTVLVFAFFSRSIQQGMVWSGLKG